MRLPLSLIHHARALHLSDHLQTCDDDRQPRGAHVHPLRVCFCGFASLRQKPATNAVQIQRAQIHACSLWDGAKSALLIGNVPADATQTPFKGFIKGMFP